MGRKVAGKPCRGSRIPCFAVLGSAAFGGLGGIAGHLVGGSMKEYNPKDGTFLGALSGVMVGSMAGAMAGDYLNGYYRNEDKKERELQLERDTTLSYDKDEKEK